jgi:hypothetical protein
MEQTVFTCSYDRNTLLFSVIILVIMVAPTVFISIMSQSVVSRIVSFFLITLNAIIIISVYLLLPLKYTLDHSYLTIKRPGPDVVISLKKIQHVGMVDDTLLRDSIRLLGNGGLGGFVGVYKNKTLGTYKSYRKRTDNIVLIETSSEKYILSPDDPLRFVNTVNDKLKNQRVNELIQDE